MKRMLVALALMVGSPVVVHGQSLALGEPVYGGTGCPRGTARAVVGPNATTLSILFDQYEAGAGGASGRSFDRKSCNLAIPLEAPSGYSVSILAIDYRGFNYLPQAASSVFRVEYFFAGAVGPVFTRTFTGPRNDDFLISNALQVNARVWSACGADVILRTNSSIRVMTSANRQAIATVDTEDIAAAIVYRLQWRRC